MSYATQLAAYSAAQIMTATGCPRGTAYDWKDAENKSPHATGYHFPISFS